MLKAILCHDVGGILIGVRGLAVALSEARPGAEVNAPNSIAKSSVSREAAQP